MATQSYNTNQGGVQLAELVARECERIALSQYMRCAKEGAEPDQAAAAATNKIVELFAPLHARPGITRELIEAQTREWVEAVTGEKVGDYHFDLAWRHAVRAAKWRDGRILAGLEKIPEPTAIEAEVDAITGYVGVTAAEISMRTTLAKGLLDDIGFGPCNAPSSWNMMMNAGWSWAETIRQAAVAEEIKPFASLAAVRYPADDADEKGLRNAFEGGFNAWWECGGVAELGEPPAKKQLALPAGAVAPFPSIQRDEPQPTEGEKLTKATKRASRTEKLAADWEARFGGNGS